MQMKNITTYFQGPFETLERFMPPFYHKKICIKPPPPCKSFLMFPYMQAYPFCEIRFKYEF